LLKNPLMPRLLKKTQMQGGATHPLDGYPPRGTHRRWVGGVLGLYAAAPHPSARWADGYPVRQSA